MCINFSSKTTHSMIVRIIITNDLFRKKYLNDAILPLLLENKMLKEFEIILNKCTLDPPREIFLLKAKNCISYLKNNSEIRKLYQSRMKQLILN